MATYFRFSASNESEISSLLGMYSYVSEIIYHDNATADIIVNDIALCRVYIVETSASVAEYFDN